MSSRLCLQVILFFTSCSSSVSADVRTSNDSDITTTYLQITVYSNSLLAALNSRKKIRAAADGVQTTSENLSLSLQEFPRNGGISMATKVGTPNL